MNSRHETGASDRHDHGLGCPSAGHTAEAVVAGKGAAVAPPAHCARMVEQTAGAPWAMWCPAEA